MSDKTREEIPRAKRRENGKILSEYSIWIGIKMRCHNPNDKAYPAYGGRGIKMCERWRNSYDAFIFDMGWRPSKLHSVDRFPDNDGDYGPDNCRWATIKEQSNNSRMNSFFTYRGETKTMTQLAEKYGFKLHTLCTRLVRLKWPIEKAIETPTRKHLQSLPKTV